MKKTVDLLFQIIPVMIGVYLGFVVSNWSENRKKDYQANVFISNLRSEIETNRELLESIIDYHIMLRDSSQFYSESKTNIKKPGFFQGTRIMKLNSSAYNTGIQTGIINELSIDIIQIINQLYTYQEEYDEFGNMMMSSFINMNFSDNEEDLKKIARFLGITMTDIVIKETGLIEGYESLLNTLDIL